MEIYITTVDLKTTKEKLRDALVPVLQRFKIDVFDVRRKTGTTVAYMTIADIHKAQLFLATAKKNPSFTELPAPNNHAKFLPGKRAADPQLLRVLQKEEKDLRVKKNVLKIGKKSRNEDKILDAVHSPLLFLMLECGRWSLAKADTRFIPFYRKEVDGTVTREGRILVLKFRHLQKDVEVRIKIYNIRSCALSRVLGRRTLTIHSLVAPGIYEKAVQSKDSLFQHLLSPYMTTKANFRISTLPDASSLTTGTCLTYRLTLNSMDAPGGLGKHVQALTSNQIPINRLPIDTNRITRLFDFEQEVGKLNAIVRNLRWSFPLKFQLQALWSNAAFSPAEVRQLVPEMNNFRVRFGENKLVLLLQRLALRLPSNTAESDLQTNLVATASAIMEEQDAFVVKENIQSMVRKSGRDEVSVHRVLITPTGIYLYGSEEVAANRILRQHRANSDCFLRVSFADENEDRISYDRDFSNHEILYGRFLTVLRDGLNIAGEQFDFLGFSHSSLRSQTCWFMRPISHPTGLLHARALITSLGDFSGIRCPAKCAARIGQAFSETSSAISIDPRAVTKCADIKTGRYLFTDGCGTVSPTIWKKLKSASSSKVQPTLYQIRYQGAKGMISLDTSLRGPQLRLRDSMIKFTGSPSDELEICATNARALPFKLNRQIIKILEDLGIPSRVFEDLQEQAVEKLQISATSATSAHDFLSQQFSDNASGLPTLLKALKDTGIDVTEDTFLRDVLGALLQVKLQDIKYKTHILVPNAKTLYGICDETGFLREGEIFVVYTDEQGQSFQHQGQVAITRSPALHPGDIQLAIAVKPPNDLILHNLTNSVVFSQNGSRDMPSMLSGGDLDGDLYNVIFDPRLIPNKACEPAAYLPVVAEDIGRSVTSQDMTKFFIDFMQNDQLGRIATLHQVFADQEPEGVRSAVCLLLAELHSNAVDFSKSGIPVDVKQIPPAPKYRPDFMAPSPSTKVEKGIDRSEQTRDVEGQQRYRYYESDRVLGRLYRAIDEDAFFQDLRDDASSIFSQNADDNVLREILQFVTESMHGRDWLSLRGLAGQIRDHYESTLLDIMTQYAVGRTEPLTEKEVFIGIILGRPGSASRLQREQSDYLKARFNRELREIKSWMEIQMNDRDQNVVDLAAACLYVAVSQPRAISQRKVEGELKSFGWFAAGLCVPQLVHWEERNGLSRMFAGLSM